MSGGNVINYSRQVADEQAQLEQEEAEREYQNAKRNFYLNSKGGLIGHIPDNLLTASKNENDFPDKTSAIMALLKFPKSKYIIENKVIIFGTYNLRLQPYYGDIDMRSDIIINLPKEEAVKFVAKCFQDVVKRVEKTRGAFFTDAKAGIYDDGEAVHWTAKEVLKGKRNGSVPDFNGHLGDKNLLDAILDKSIVRDQNVLLKIDAVVPYYGKYLECTNVYDIKYIDENGNTMGLNVPILSEKESFNTIIRTLLKDTQKQRLKKKYFKVIKRIYALTRYYNDISTIKKIEPLLVSNVSKLSTINSDLGTLELLITLNKKISKTLVNNELNVMIDKLSNMLDIDFDSSYVIKTLENLYQNIRQDDRMFSLGILEEITNYIQDICNNEVGEYLRSIGYPNFASFGKKYII